MNIYLAAIMSLCLVFYCYQRRFDTDTRFQLLFKNQAKTKEKRNI